MIRDWLAETISSATDGTVSTATILSADCSLMALGVTSMAMVRVMDAIDEEYDVSIDFDDGSVWASLDRLTAYVSTQLP